MVKSTSLRAVSDRQRCGTNPTSNRHSLRSTDRSQELARMNRTKLLASSEYTPDKGRSRRAHAVEPKHSFLAERRAHARAALEMIMNKKLESLCPSNAATC